MSRDLAGYRALLLRKVWYSCNFQYPWPRLKARRAGRGRGRRGAGWGSGADWVGLPYREPKSIGCGEIPPQDRGGGGGNRGIRIGTSDRFGRGRGELYNIYIYIHTCQHTRTDIYIHVRMYVCVYGIVCVLACLAFFRSFLPPPLPLFARSLSLSLPLSLFLSLSLSLPLSLSLSLSLDLRIFYNTYLLNHTFIYIYIHTHACWLGNTICAEVQTVARS